MATKYHATRLLEIVMGGASIEIEAALEYTIAPYVPAQGPSYDSGGQPAEGGGVEDIWVKGIKYAAPGGAADASKPDCPEWLADWIIAEVDGDELYQEAMEHDNAERDEAAEMRHESYREMRALNEDLGID